MCSDFSLLLNTHQYVWEKKNSIHKSCSWHKGEEVVKPAASATYLRQQVWCLFDYPRQTSNQWELIIVQSVMSLLHNHDSFDTQTVKTLVWPQTHKRKMSSICKYYTRDQIKDTDIKCSTCDFSVLSKASGINRTVFENSNSYRLGHRIRSQLY